MSTATAEPDAKAPDKIQVPSKSKKEPVTRGYVVLRLNSETGQWAVLHDSDKNRFSAVNDQRAIEAALDRSGEDDRTGTFVAVAERYWNPRTPSVETIQRVTWS